MSWATRLGRVFSRRKQDDDEKEAKDQLARVLGLGDLTMLGVGSTLGVGVYVLAGAVAKTNSGPAVTLSFLVAAVASAFAGLCYAEFAARVPKAGSAYVYSYVTVGELAAFIIGWNLILEYIIGTASVSRALSNYIDSLTGSKMSEALIEAVPLGVSWLSPYPDLLSAVFVLILSALLAWGVKESSALNNVFTAVNLLVVAAVIIGGAFFANFHNWAIDKSDIPAVDPSSGAPINGGEGGFMPFGFSGVMAGAAKCFYGFLGFDCVATTGEEAKNPKRDIPLSIILSLLIIFLAYFGIASVLTLMLPYYLQDTNAPIPYVFDQVNLAAVKYPVSIGALLALTASLLGSLFAVPRMLYSMAKDGLLYEPLARVHPYTQTPLIATAVGGIVAALLAAIFNLDQLIDMMSIGTLLAFTIVAFCVLVLRFRNPCPVVYEINLPLQNDFQNPLSSHHRHVSWVSDIFNLRGLKDPSRASETVALWALAVYMAAAAVLCILLNFADDLLTQGSVPVLVITIVLAVVILSAVVVLCRQPQAPVNLNFKVPLVPILPCASIIMNFYLMVKLDINTWIRFIVWLIIGLLIYVFYSIPNSVEGKRDRERDISAADFPPRLQEDAKKHSQVDNTNLHSINNSNHSL